MIDVPKTTAAAHKLFADGANELAVVERNGMRVDVDYLDKQIDKVGKRIADIESELRGMEEFKLQRREFGQKTKLTSRDQLKRVLYDIQGHECKAWTSGGESGNKRKQLDETALERIGTPYCREFLRLEKLRKLLSTSLKGFKSEIVDGYLHPFFNLHTVRSFRSSSSDPNCQNIPKRDGESAKIVRRMFIPRDGHVLVETDYSTLEVRVACSLSGDEKLTYDTVEGDMHRDMAAECYMLPSDEITKSARFTAKGGFVFAQFYGDWYKQCARNLWDAIERDGLATKSGVPMKEHLESQGIDELGLCDPKTDAVAGTMEYHIQQVENRFWNKRFRVYHEWRQELVRQYRRRGWFKLVTGFVCAGTYTKNQIINYPIQGPAFHCLLWSLIQISRWLRKNKMRTRLIGQIHDSIVADVHRSELDDYKAKVHEITTTGLVKAWDWVKIPMEVEMEIGEENWFDMKEIEL